jgi:hypothetical protein
VNNMNKDTIVYIIKHVPTGKFLRKVKNPNLYVRIFTGSAKWNGLEHFLTDDINKARVYGNINHIKSSLANINGEINPKLWEVIELVVSIKGEIK